MSKVGRQSRNKQDVSYGPSNAYDNTCSWFRSTYTRISRLLLAYFALGLVMPEYNDEWKS